MIEYLYFLLWAYVIIDYDSYLCNVVQTRSRV
jgi:hypothetical protein